MVKTTYFFSIGEKEQIIIHSSASAVAKKLNEGNILYLPVNFSVMSRMTIHEMLAKLYSVLNDAMPARDEAVLELIVDAEEKAVILDKTHRAGAPKNVSRFFTALDFHIIRVSAIPKTNLSYQGLLAEEEDLL